MTFGEVTIPRVSSIEIGRQLIGEEARTATGTMRSDVVAVKRRWRVETSPLTETEAAEISNYLQGVFFQTKSFQAESMSSPVDAKILPNSFAENIIQFGMNGWERWGRTLTFEVVEV